MSVFVHAQGIKTVHAEEGVKMAKFCPYCWIPPNSFWGDEKTFSEVKQIIFLSPKKKLPDININKTYNHIGNFQMFELLIARKSALEKTQLSDVLITDNLFW